MGVRFLLFCMVAALACGDDSGDSPAADAAGGDTGGGDDAGPDEDAQAPDAGEDAGGPVLGSTDHCTYEEPLPTAGAGGTVTEGEISAGGAERELRIPVTAALGAYTARVDFLGDIDTPDQRFTELSGTFVPSYGIETRIKAKALAITAGDETVVVIKADLALADEAITHAVSQRLGDLRDEDFGGKILFATTHSHSAFAQYTANSVLWVGLGRKRQAIVDSLVEDLVAVADQALDARVPASIGIAYEPNFDPGNEVTRDRRSENDELSGGQAKDNHLFVMRVDTLDGDAIAIMSVFGIHGTVLDADNLLASTEAIGAIERAVEESFDYPVIVMHLQGAAGDVSPAGTGRIQCEAQPCYNFARVEHVGRLARDWILTAWMDASEDAFTTTSMEMVTQSIHLGPLPEGFTVRDGGLRYADWDGTTMPDGTVFDGEGNIVSPIDEFNAPYGAALCGEDGAALFPGAQIPGTRTLEGPYQSCMRLEVASDILGTFFDLPFEPMPACSATRTSISAWRLGDHLFVTVPGEPVTLFADRLRNVAPTDAAHTIIVGFAQDHIGYVMTAEDWLQAGYEPSINVWGPLEGEYVGERIDSLMDLAMTDEREEPEQATRYLPLIVDESDLPEPDDAPMAGTIEATPWDRQYVRGGEPLTSGQPASQIERLESATFAWIGHDPRVDTPSVTLQREVSPGVFEDMRRRSRRVIDDQDLLLFHTPDPLIRNRPSEPRTHRWAVEWQAVVPWGTEGLDELADRSGLPLGRYRFHVVGLDYDFESEPIEVLPATISISAQLDGGTLTATATFDAQAGWRLLRAQGPSNDLIPITGPVTVILDRSGTPETLTDVEIDENGELSIPASGTVTAFTVEDRFGNLGTHTF